MKIPPLVPLLADFESKVIFTTPHDQLHQAQHRLCSVPLLPQKNHLFTHSVCLFPVSSILDIISLGFYRDESRLN